MIECIMILEKIYGAWQYEYVIVSGCGKYAIRIFAGFQENTAEKHTVLPDIVFGLFSYHNENPKWLSTHLRADLNDIINMFPEFGQLLLRNMDVINNHTTQTHPQYPSFSGVGFKERIAPMLKSVKHIIMD